MKDVKEGYSAEEKMGSEKKEVNLERSFRDSKKIGEYTSLFKKMGKYTRALLGLTLAAHTACSTEELFAKSSDPSLPKEVKMVIQDSYKHHYHLEDIHISSVDSPYVIHIGQTHSTSETVFGDDGRIVMTPEVETVLPIQKNIEAILLDFARSEQEKPVVFLEGVADTETINLIREVCDNPSSSERKRLPREIVEYANERQVKGENAVESLVRDALLYQYGGAMKAFCDGHIDIAPTEAEDPELEKELMALLDQFLLEVDIAISSLSDSEKQEFRDEVKKCLKIGIEAYVSGNPPQQYREMLETVFHGNTFREFYKRAFLEREKITMQKIREYEGGGSGRGAYFLIFGDAHDFSQESLTEGGPQGLNYIKFSDDFSE